MTVVCFVQVHTLEYIQTSLKIKELYVSAIWWNYTSGGKKAFVESCRVPFATCNIQIILSHLISSHLISDQTSMVLSLTESLKRDDALYQITFGVNFVL